MALISSYSDDAATTDTDRFLTYASDGTTKLTPASNVNQYVGPGWILSADSWTFSSYNSTTAIGVINANSGANTKYSASNWLRFSQPTLGVKYGRVQSSTSTTITVKFYGGTVLSNEAITSPVYSTALSPFGAPSASLEAADISFASTGSGVWWEEIARTTLTVAGGTVSVTSIPARKYLYVYANGIATGGTLNTTLRLNNDSGTTYAYVESVSFGAGASTVSQTSVPVEAGATTSGQMQSWSMEVFNNVSSQEKNFMLHNVSQNASGGATAPSVLFEYGKWANTSAQINRIDWINGGTGNFAIGSELIVLGHN